MFETESYVSFWVPKGPCYWGNDWKISVSLRRFAISVSVFDLDGVASSVEGRASCI